MIVHSFDVYVLIHLIQHPGSAVDWLSLVDRFGYYDHSHLIRDFQYFLGMTPQFKKQLGEETICINKSGRFYGYMG